MKKISVAVLAAAMLAGTVTAADVGFSYKGTNYFSKPSNGRIGHIGRADCLSVSLTDERGGVVLDFDTDANDAFTGIGLKQDEYYGWVNFGGTVGQLQVTGGRWSGRNVNRVLTDRGDLEEWDFELFKPGVINGTAGYDSANLTNGNLGLVGAWTLADVLPGTLMVKLGLANYYDKDWNINENRKDGANSNARRAWAWNPDADSFTVRAGFAGEVSYRQEGAFAANFAVRSLNKHTHSFGAWISPELADTLQMTIGGTVAAVQLWDKTTKSEWEKGRFEWGIDFRLRLQVTDDLSITTMNNMSSGINPDSGDSEGMLWNMLNATYQIADNLTAAFTLQSVADLFCPAVKDSGAWTLIMSPSLVIQATEKARITTSVRATMPNTRNWTINNMGVVVPVIFSFNY